MRYNFYGSDRMRGWKYVGREGKTEPAHPSEFMSEGVELSSVQHAIEYATSLAQRWRMNVNGIDQSLETIFIYFEDVRPLFWVTEALCEAGFLAMGESVPDGFDLDDFADHLQQLAIPHATISTEEVLSTARLPRSIFDKALRGYLAEKTKGQNDG